MKEAEREILQRDFIIFGKYYLPSETIQLAGNDHYVKWVKEGWITETPGARTDFLYIENDLKLIHADNPIIELAFDPREATYLINNVSTWIGSHIIDGQDVSRCIEITQGPTHMSVFIFLANFSRSRRANFERREDGGKKTSVKYQ